MPLDTLSISQRLHEAGLPQEAAETHAQILREVVEGDLATSHDLELLHRDFDTLRQEFEALRKDIRAMEQRLLTELDTRMELLKRDLFLKIAAAQFVTLGLFVTLTKLL